MPIKLVNLANKLFTSLGDEQKLPLTSTTFLYVENTFDKAFFWSMEETARSVVTVGLTSGKATKWIGNMIRNRTIHVPQNFRTITAAVGAGGPQAGVVVVSYVLNYVNPKKTTTVPFT